MPDLPVVGRVENPDDLDLDPIVVPIAGYTLDRQEVIEKFRFRPWMPAGQAFEVQLHTDGDGRIALTYVMRYLEAALLEGEQERFDAFLNRRDVEIQSSVLVDLYHLLSEHYGNRPTLRSSGSAASRSTAKRTSGAGPRGAGSASTRRRSR